MTRTLGSRCLRHHTEIHIDVVRDGKDITNPPANVIAFRDAGRKLADLHLNYESAPPMEGITVNGDIGTCLTSGSLHEVTKMKLDPAGRKLVYNSNITIENIPEEAFGYVVNGRSSLGWLVEEYQISTDKESGIVNDPNGYARGAYILKLVLSVITVSAETVRITEGLPGLDFGDEEKEGVLFVEVGKEIGSPIRNGRFRYGLYPYRSVPSIGDRSTVTVGLTGIGNTAFCKTF